MSARRAWLVGAAVLWVAIVVVWVGHDVRSARESAVSGSVYDTSGRGTSLAFGYLSRHGHRVSVLTRSLTPSDVERGAVVFRFAPDLVPAQLDRSMFESNQDEKKKPTRVLSILTPAEEEWVRQGGRLVIATGAQYGPVDPEKIESGARPVKVFPIWPDVRRIAPDPLRAFDLSSLTGAHAIFAAGGRAVVARWIVGHGDVVVVASSEMFDNAHLATADHLALLDALAARRPVVEIDETVHGIVAERGLVNLLVREWSLGPLLVLLALVSILYWLRGTRRLGPPNPEIAAERSDTIDLVGSLGSLYERSLSREEMLELYRRALVRGIAARTGLTGRALEARADELAGPAPTRPLFNATLSRDEFLRRLSALNDAFGRLDHAESR